MDQKAGSEKELGQAPEAETVPGGGEHPDKGHPEYGSTSTGTGANPAASAPPSARGSASAWMPKGAPVVENAERCTGCRWCELHCPDFAICVREVEKSPEASENEERWLVDLMEVETCPGGRGGF